MTAVNPLPTCKEVRGCKKGGVVLNERLGSGKEKGLCTEGW